MVLSFSSRPPKDLRQAILCSALQKPQMNDQNCSQKIDLFAHGTDINASIDSPREIEMNQPIVSWCERKMCLDKNMEE